MINKCVKLVLVLALVVAVAFGISFLPFSLSDKFKQVAEKVTSHIKGLTGLNNTAGAKLNLDFSKRDNYKLGEFNVVFDRVNNVPKEGFHKFVHKGENDATLDVEKFFNGETELEGVEGGLFDYAAAYFKGDSPFLLLVELGLHEKETTETTEKSGQNNQEEAKTEAKEGEKKTDTTPTETSAAETPAQKPTAETAAAATAPETPTQKPSAKKKLSKAFFAPGENNKWVKLGENEDLAEKVEEVFNALSAAAAAASAAKATPKEGEAGPEQSATLPEGGEAGEGQPDTPAEGAGAGTAAGEENAGKTGTGAPAPDSLAAPALGTDGNTNEGQGEGLNQGENGLAGAAGLGNRQSTQSGAKPAEAAAQVLSGGSTNAGLHQGTTNLQSKGTGLTTTRSPQSPNTEVTNAQTTLRGAQGTENANNGAGNGGNGGGNNNQGGRNSNTDNSGGSSGSSSGSAGTTHTGAGAAGTQQRATGGNRNGDGSAQT